MIDSPSDLARRLLRDARARKLAERYWAGWKLSLSFGPYDQAMPPQDIAFAKAVVRQMIGSDPPPDTGNDDTWHLSASWRGAYPAADGKRALDDLVVALGVPESERAGRQPVRMFNPDGRPSPQVTHWIWRDA